MMTALDQARQAERLLAAGDHRRAMDAYAHLLASYADGRTPIGADDLPLIEEASTDLVDLLRWSKRHRDAVAVEEMAGRLLPSQSLERQTLAAILRVEAGDEEEGLAMLKRLAATGGAAQRLALGSTYLWSGRLGEAEEQLTGLGADVDAHPGDRAEAEMLLFRLLGAARRLPEAANAFARAVDLEPERIDRLSELVRFRLYWYDYRGALAELVRDPSALRQRFYKTLIEYRTRPAFTRRDWAWVLDIDPAGLGGDRPEFAEAALRGVWPHLTLAITLPLLEARELTRQHLLHAGLAWAQQRKLERAAWALSLAVRAADLERPRRTRPGGSAGRILDAASRILYGEVPIDNDIRAHLDRFFIPSA